MICLNARANYQGVYPLPGGRATRAAIACFNRDAASTEADVGHLERAAQHVEQVGAVHRDVRRAELLAECASTHTRNDPPALPAADDQKIRLRPEGNDCILDAKHTERHQGVGAKVKAGAYFVQCGRLLADDDFDAPPLQRQSRGKAADAATDDGNAWRARHSSHLLRHPDTSGVSSSLPEEACGAIVAEGDVMSPLKFPQAWERLVIFARRPYRQTERHHVGNGPQARWTAGRASIASCQRFRLG